MAAGLAGARLDNFAVLVSWWSGGPPVRFGLAPRRGRVPGRESLSGHAGHDDGAACGNQGMAPSEPSEQSGSADGSFGPSRGIGEVRADVDERGELQRLSFGQRVVGANP